jgi:hypothetical protein
MRRNTLRQRLRAFVSRFYDDNGRDPTDDWSADPPDLRRSGAELKL